MSIPINGHPAIAPVATVEVADALASSFCSLYCSHLPTPRNSPNRFIGNMAGRDCKVVVPGEPHHKIECLGTDAPQFVRDAQAFNILLHNRHRKSRADEMNAGAARSNEQRDNPGQAFGPIARPEQLALRRHAADQVTVNIVVIHVAGITGVCADG